MMKSVEFERKLLSNTCLIIMVGMVLAMVFNIVMKLERSLIITTFVAFLIFSSLYLLSKREKYLSHVKWLITIFSLILINFAWLTNYGSVGPTFYLFILYLTYIIFLWEKPLIYYFLFAIFLNLTANLFIELKWPEFLSGYDTRRSQIIDLYLGLLISSSTVILFSISVKRFFTEQSNEIKKSDQQKGLLLRDISHKIRTPLNAIVGFSDLIDNDTFSTDEKKDYKENIWQNSKILTNIIDNIIDLSNLENGRLKPVFNTFNLIHLVDRVTLSAQKRKNWMGRRNISVRFEKELFNVLILSDEERLERVLNNLLNYAIESSDHGEVVIRCKTELNKVFVFILDSGRPISKQEQLVIFNRFNDFSDFYTTKYNSGIDLYLSYEIIKCLGGELSYAAGKTQGNIFTFWLPVTQ